MAEDPNANDLLAAQRARETAEHRLAQLKAESEARALEKASHPSFLADWNNRLTTMGTAVATIAAMFSGYNAYRIGQLDNRTKTEDASYRFATLFLDKAMASESLKKHERSVPALLSILDIAAQASSSDRGASNAEARAVLPIHLALLLGEAGTVAELDRDCVHAKTWVELAKVATQDETRLTAIEALVPLAKKALADRRLGALSSCVRDLDDLLGLIRHIETAGGGPEGGAGPSDPKVVKVMAVRTAALGARADLAYFLEKNRSAVALAELEKGAVGDAVELRNRVLSAFPAAVATAQDAKIELRSSQANLPVSDQNARQVSSNAQSVLDRVDVVLTTAAKDVSRTSSQAGEAGQPAMTPEEQNRKRLAGLLQQIKNTKTAPPERQKARSELALIGQPALKPLLLLAERDDLAGNPLAVGGKKQELERMNGEVAAILTRMQQPLRLDVEDAAAVIKLLRSDVRNTRMAIADFLMNLEDEAGIHAIYFQFEEIRKHASEKEIGSAVANAALILATWARNLSWDIQSPEPNLTMREFALKKAKVWQQELPHVQHEGGWNITISLLNELIPRAEASQKMRATNSITPTTL
jgi:hypothetical protein